MKNPRKIYQSDGQDQFLPRLSLKVFNHPRTVATVWLLLTVFGLLSYTTFLQREGFPSVNIPYSVISGTYLVNNPGSVDAQVTKPIDDIVLKNSSVKTVQSHAQANFYDVIIQYKDGTDAVAVGKHISQQITAAGAIPPRATVKVETPKFGFTERGDDGVISLYAKQKGVTTQQLVDASSGIVNYIKSQHFANLESISVINPFLQGTNPVTGQPATTQSKFDRYGARQDNQNKFYDSVSVGYMQKDGTDVLKLNDKIVKAVDDYNAQHKDSPYEAVQSATYANDIREQVNELQQSLLEGLLAVLVIGSVVIAVRAALITILSMASVLAITTLFLFLIGSTLNTITLFALILCLGLVVDDTIIMVEAIDAQRRKQKDPQHTVQVATRKVSRAMVAATSTAALSFAPFLFVGGVLGSFIREIPITIIASLVISLSVALFFIPFFARFLLLGKKQMGDSSVYEPAANIEARIARFIATPMLWARDSRKKLLFVGILALAIGIGFIMGGGAIFQKVTFNIFPPDKDSNNLSVQVTFPPGTDIKQAEAVTDRADQTFAKSIGSDFRSASYYSMADSKSATLTVYLSPYTKRSITAPQLQKRANDTLKDFKGAQVKVIQQSNGPPASAFSVQIQTDNRPAAERLAKNINEFLSNRALTRPSGKVAHISSTSISDPGTYYRAQGNQYTEVTADFDGDDTSTLVTLAKDAVKKEYTPQKLASYGLPKSAIQYDIGQEQDNQDSFKTLAYAFPVLLLAIFVLLALQFRSLAQPLLIFLAIPFSLFGITLGLYLTNNPFSFFAMLGFFALIGLSIKNTILLTDYANQLRRSGAPAVDAAVGALGERFRPLIATSLTAVVSLIPLSLTSPFWQGLTVVLIFGLLSSTFLVITVFPYYYLGAEFIRLRIRRRAVLLWLVLTIVIAVIIGKAGASPALIPLASFIIIVIETIFGRRRNRRTA